MARATHAGHQIETFADGSLFRARVHRTDGALIEAAGKTTKIWETSQFVDPNTALGQAIYAIDIGRIK
jgi:hypothetical protein